jgi:enoyl-CoA hydratase/carnithine racemase
MMKCVPRHEVRGRSSQRRTITLGTTTKLKLAVADGVATISLNRPERHNAVDDELHDGLAETWALVLADPAARVILLRGEGRSFCSGRDTAQFACGRPGRATWHSSAGTSTPACCNSTARSR